MAFDFFDRHRNARLDLGYGKRPVAGAQSPTLRLGIYGAAPADIAGHCAAERSRNPTCHGRGRCPPITRIWTRATQPRAAWTMAQSNPWAAVDGGACPDYGRARSSSRRSTASRSRSGSLHVSGKTAWMRGAVVAQQARGRGIQRALIAARARAAEEFGCNLVGASAEPELVSARQSRAVRDAAHWACARTTSTTRSEQTTCIVERTGPDGSVARVTLNRPEVHNAFNAELIGELRTTVHALSRTSPPTRCAPSSWPAPARRSAPARTSTGCAPVAGPDPRAERAGRDGHGRDVRRDRSLPRARGGTRPGHGARRWDGSVRGL